MIDPQFAHNVLVNGDYSGLLKGLAVADGTSSSESTILILMPESKTKPYNVPKILSSSSSLPLLAKTNAPCSAVSLRQLRYLSIMRLL